MSTPKLPVEIKADVDGDFAHLYLVFSIDNGTHWYEVEMQHKPPHYSINLPHQPQGLKILYMFKAIGLNKEEFLENNQGQFFTYLVGSDTSKSQDSAQSPFISEEEPSSHSDLSKSAVSLSSTKIEKPDIIYEQDTEPIVELNHQKEPISKSEPESEFESESDLNLESTDKILPSIELSEKFTEGHTTTSNSTTGPNFQSPFVKSTSPLKEVSNHDVKTKVVQNIDDQTIKTKPPEQTIPIKEDIARPIIPYNPFTIEDGNIGQNTSAIQSFSKLIGARSIEQPNKQKSFINRPQIANSKNCISCKAILNLNWKVCPICGNKI